MQPFAVFESVTAPFLLRNHLTLLAAPEHSPSAPSLVSFVTTLQYNPQSPLHPSLAIAALTCLAVHHPDTLAQLDVLPLDLLVNAGALQQRALLRIIRTSALVSPLPGATCLATLEAGAAGDVPIDVVITALNAFPTAVLLRLTRTLPTAGVPSAHPATATAWAFLHSSGIPGHAAPLPVLPPVGLHPMPVIGQNAFIGVAFV